MPDIKEEWRDIEGYEGLYQVSNLGRVKKVNHRNTGQERILKKPITCFGYERVQLWKDGKPKKFFVHRLVAKAFIPNPRKKQVNHKNGIKTDNCVENLEWVSAAENTQHAINNNLRHPNSGEKNGAAKLTNKQADDIRKEYIKGSKDHNQYMLAKKYGVSVAKICNIINNKSYKT